MSIVPTSSRIGSTLEQIARIIAAVAVAAFVAGEMTGRFIHRLNDWMASAIHDPATAAGQCLAGLAKMADTILPDPQPAGAMLLANGAILLTPEDLDREIEKFEEQKPVVRRKPARVRKAKVAA